MMTAAEHEAMDMTARLWDHMVQNVIVSGPTRAHDEQELAAKIHAIQDTIMGQSAAREHPDRYRLLGDVIDR